MPAPKHRNTPFTSAKEAVKGWNTYLHYRALQRNHMHTYFRYTGGTETSRRAVEKADLYAAAAESYEPWISKWIES